MTKSANPPEAPAPDRPGWPEEARERYRAAGFWREEVLADLLAQQARRRPDAGALVDGARRWTYAELASEAGAVAAGLHRRGVRRGDRVVVQLPNRAEFLLLWFGLQYLGAVPVHAMPGHRGHEISHLLRTTGAVGYAVADRHARFDYRTLAASMLEEHEGLRHVIVVGDTGGLEGAVGFGELRADAPANSTPAPARPDPGDIALLLLSGGTTGTPKLIPRTHQDYGYNARAAADACGLTADSVYLAVLPAAFNFTMCCPGILGTLTAGGTVVMAPSPAPETAFPLIAREGVTVTALSPPMVPVWLEAYADRAPGTAELESLSVLQVGGARLADDLARRVRPALGCRLQQVFGMAEGLINVTRLDDPEELVCTTQGRPISSGDEVRVVDGSGAPVPVGAVGELLTRGPYTLRGYYRSPELATTHFTPDGFYRTGDLVRLLPSGHIDVVGRVKDQINRGGEKIDATEVESQLLAYPGVSAAALVAAPDPDLGERSVAFLVCAGAPPTVRELAAFLRGRGLAGYKSPDRIETVDAFPLTAVGKVDKNALRERSR
ncbi:(2,3-dihydroxybenzoyl)adenylate synthase [Nocardiopsis tropica]|uniref:AMP-binding protein n=1 Tax=Nocardiopsis tropica TaxID=109330 RepID=A0ABU7KYT4_9ACTN|nr:AMP-binding protein [Nocardiopsis umidischolae]MEE2054473.1 AMP-binding protein [Nocardiopsis umidischolae]